MPRYAIVQYVPDAVTNERINIGVVVLDQGRARSLFVHSLARVKHFAGKDVSFLRKVQFDSRLWDEETVFRLSKTWTGSVQFTAPAYSMLNADQLLFDTAKRFLFEQAAADRGYRGKTEAVRIVRSRIKERLLDEVGAAGSALIKGPRYELGGKHLAYRFDVSVANCKPYFAAQGVSFEVPDTKHLEKEISSTAWLIEDVKAKEPHLPLAVAVLPPKDSKPVYDSATKLFRDLGAEVLVESEVSAWAGRMIKTLPEEMLRRRVGPL